MVHDPHSGHTVVDIVTDIISTVQQRQIDCTGSPDDMKDANEQISDWKVAIKIVLEKKRQAFFKNMDERLKDGKCCFMDAHHYIYIYIYISI